MRAEPAFFFLCDPLWTLCVLHVSRFFRGRLRGSAKFFSGPPNLFLPHEGGGDAIRKSSSPGISPGNPDGGILDAAVPGSSPGMTRRGMTTYWGFPFRDGVGVSESRGFVAGDGRLGAGQGEGGDGE